MTVCYQNSTIEYHETNGQETVGISRRGNNLSTKLVNIRVTDKNGAMDVPAIRKIVEETEAEMNGEGRILVRPSGTEPLLRVMAEAPTIEKVDYYVEKSQRSFERKSVRNK